MKSFASSSVQSLETLIRYELEQTQFVLPKVRCVIKQHILFIVLDYAELQTIDLKLGRKAIHRALAQSALDCLDLSGNADFQGSVRCYWRQLGQRKPWASCYFQYEPLEEASGIVLTDKRAAECSSANVNRQYSSSNMSSSQSSFSKGSIAGFPPLLSRGVPVVRKEEPTARRFSMDFTRFGLPQAPSKFMVGWKALGLKTWRWGLGLRLTAGLGAVSVVGAIGLGTYAWSRPCVANTCTILDQAQAINASLELDANASLEDVAQTYTALLDINYQLSRVPFWSPHYDEVKGLLTTYETHTHLVAQILGAEEQAQVAIASSQFPPYPLHDWQETQEKWQDAIQTLEPVSQQTIVSPLAQTQLQEYSTKLQSIEQKMKQEQTALNKVRAARKFAQIAEMNSSSALAVEQLQQVEGYWQNALDRLTDVAEDTMAYAEAQHLRAIYAPQLLDVRDRLSQERLAAEGYGQAIAAAEQSVILEQEQQWSLAVDHWQQALDHINQVPEHTTYYGQVVPLRTSYTAALTNAQDHLQTAVSLKNAQDELAKRCSAVPTVCEAVTSDAVVHVWLATAPDENVDSSSTALAASSIPMTPGVKSISAIPVNPSQTSSARNVSQTWLGNISAVGKTMKVTIHVYYPDGSLFGTYNPQTSSFVRTHTMLGTQVVDDDANEAMAAIAQEEL